MQGHGFEIIRVTLIVEHILCNIIITINNKNSLHLKVYIIISNYNGSYCCISTSVQAHNNIIIAVKEEIF